MILEDVPGVSSVARKVIAAAYPSWSDRTVRRSTLATVAISSRCTFAIVLAPRTASTPVVRREHSVTLLTEVALTTPLVAHSAVLAWVAIVRRDVYLAPVTVPAVATALAGIAHCAMVLDFVALGTFDLMARKDDPFLIFFPRHRYSFDPATVAPLRRGTHFHDPQI